MTGWDEQDTLQAGMFHRYIGDTQMPKVDGGECPAKNANVHG